jgi:NAD(P)-dependent dehydrogenase (short-subunit alcohol dehydrogenase family)
MPTTPPNQNWTPADAPRQDGKVAIVTGPTSGIGFETALGLARQGATTILAARNPEKGRAAVARIQGTVPTATVRFEPLDLASLASIEHFAAEVSTAHNGKIDILVNSAGVMGLPVRRATQDGFERQIGVNYLGHFALTARLKQALCAGTDPGRVVSVASLAHRRAALDLDDLQSQRRYNPMQVYARSKLAMLVFAIELDRRARQNAWNLLSVAAHPGWARTEIIGNGVGEGAPGLKAWIMGAAFNFVAQSAGDGALPSLYAALAPGLSGGAYFGPTGSGETRGPPGTARIFPQAMNLANARRLWTLSEALTGATFDQADRTQAPRP